MHVLGYLFHYLLETFCLVVIINGRWYLFINHCHSDIYCAFPTLVLIEDYSLHKI